MNRGACATTSQDLIGSAPTDICAPSQCLECKTDASGYCETLHLKSAGPLQPVSTDPKYQESCLRIGDTCYRLWQKQKLCDVFIRCCGGGVVKAHRTVLAANSNFMEEKLSLFPEDETVAIDLPDFSLDVVMAVLHFVYSRDFEISMQTVGPLFKCADELGICDLVGACAEYLANVTTETSILFYAIADNYGISELREKIYCFILENFLDICNTKHFSYLHPERLLCLLSDDRLKVCSEIEVFYAVVYWLEFDRAGRLVYAPTLLKCGVRLLCISPECLIKKVESVTWLFEVPECQAILNDALRCHALKLSGSRLATEYPEQRPRTC